MEPSPTDSATMQQRELPYPRRYVRLHLLPYNGCTETKKYGPIKEQIKTPEKELSDEDIDNLSDAELKTLVIRMLTEMGEYVTK